MNLCPDIGPYLCLNRTLVGLPPAPPPDHKDHGIGGRSGWWRSGQRDVWRWWCLPRIPPRPPRTPLLLGLPRAVVKSHGFYCFVFLRASPRFPVRPAPRHGDVDPPHRPPHFSVLSLSSSPTSLCSAPRAQPDTTHRSSGPSDVRTGVPLDTRVERRRRLGGFLRSTGVMSNSGRRAGGGRGSRPPVLGVGSE